MCSVWVYVFPLVRLYLATDVEGAPLVIGTHFGNSLAVLQPAADEGASSKNPRAKRRAR